MVQLGLLPPELLLTSEKVIVQGMILFKFSEYIYFLNDKYLDNIVSKNVQTQISHALPEWK